MAKTLEDKAAVEKVAVEKAAVAEAAAGQIGLAIIRAALKLSFAETRLLLPSWGANRLKIALVEFNRFWQRIADIGRSCDLVVNRLDKGWRRKARWRPHSTHSGFRHHH